MPMKTGCSMTLHRVTPKTIRAQKDRAAAAPKQSEDSKLRHIACLVPELAHVIEELPPLNRRQMKDLYTATLKYKQQGGRKNREHLIEVLFLAAGTVRSRVLSPSGV